ncbi:hypothetical protein H5410_044867 [Solanum commersonii]|uniref:DUF295 domain-containing protein n=1 Tax=Solanum commersonii TaxID=4109 RepID=A0A9J5X7Z7_SOLCO|nr:hypothetical protein H5410_044867 [Solanum commersonii]
MHSYLLSDLVQVVQMLTGLATLLIFWRYLNWSKFDIVEWIVGVSNMIYYKRQFYLVICSSEICFVDKPMADWAGLPHDLLVLIAKRVKVIEDYIAFGCVCNSWQTASTKDNFDVLSPQLPLLMLPDDDENNYYREFYSLSKGKVSRKLYLPEAKGRDCFPTHHMGWLLTQSLDGEEVNLFNPFSATKIHLPNHFALRALQSPDDLIEEPEFYRYIKLATLSANPSFTSDYVLVISYDTDVNYLAFWLPGDINWTLFDMDERHGGVCNMTYYKGKFYLLTWGAEIWVVDVQSRDRRVESHLIYLNDNKDLFRHSIQYYLVEVNDALLFVARFGRNRSNDNSAVDTFKCEVYEVDEMKCKLKRIDNLGDSTIFLGLNGATSIDSTKFTGAIKSNHIYFTDDWDEQNLSLECGGGKDTGVYNLEDGNIEYFYPELPLSCICPPTWSYDKLYEGLSLLHQKCSVNLSLRKVSRKLYLPEAKGRECFPSHQVGWVLTQPLDGEKVNLFNPFSSTQIQLPNQFALIDEDEELIEQEEYNYIRNAILSANPSFTSDYVLVIAYNTDVNHLAFWRLGDINWTKFDRVGGVSDMIFFKGQFYLVT